MRPGEQGWHTDTIRLNDEVTFAIGNISGQQLCLSKPFSRQPLPRSRRKQTWSQAAGETIEMTTEMKCRSKQPAAYRISGFINKVS